MLAVFVFVWRVQIYRNLWSFPNRWIRLALVVLSMGAVIVENQQWYALEPMVMLLIIAYLLKLLEVDKKRDAIILLFVGYFVLACAFLFNQDIVTTILGLITLWLLTSALLIISSAVTPLISRRTIRITSNLLLQSVPLMLLMLFVFPRIGPLWSVPLQSDKSVTGVTDEMSPGEFSQLTRSSALAFRVTFEDEQVPSTNELYWRGLVLTEFDGRRWQRMTHPNLYLRHRKNLTHYQAIPEQQSYRYEIILETTNSNWLYGLPLATVFEKNVLRNVNNELLLDKPVTQRIKYQIESFPGFTVTESVNELQHFLLLPSGFNPETISQARQWLREAGSKENYIQRVLNFYHQNFSYTLSPPALGLHTVDEFLFSTQQGFCEHFASSFVVLMRAAGIPARVVTGYQGGEWNREDNYLIVRQYDAHAWAEVWMPEKGWLRFDPTAAVAPNRIEQGLLEAIPEQEQNLVSGTRLSSFHWLGQLMLEWDGINYRWQRWVLSYDRDVQAQWLEKLLVKVTPSRLAMLLVIPAVIMVTILGFLTLRQRRQPLARKVKLFHLLKHRLHRKGIALQPGETLAQFCQRARQKLPQHVENINQIEQHLSQCLYLQLTDIETNDYRRLKSLISKQL
jgi:transglutaminase-like putative cysteine protease